MGAIEEARAACDSHRWGDAWRLLSEADADEIDIEDLDRLATAAYLTGHDEEGFAHWARAHRLCADRGELHRAAHFGGKIAQGLGFKGDLGRCRGWVDRIARLLDEEGIDCVEQGYLEWGLGMLRIFEAGDISGAHGHFVRAGKIGDRFAHREVVTLARIGEGRMLVYLGEITDGMALLDEAMVSIEAGELSVLATGDAYCTVIDACAELFDLARCRSWTASFQRWCDTQQELILYRGHCFVHQAEVLGLLGAWPEAIVAGPKRLQPPGRSGQPGRPRRRLRDRGRSPPPRRRPRGRRGRLPARRSRSATIRSPGSPCCESPRIGSKQPMP